ncbi:MAG: hypothetical protein H7338_16105 [Candidatus Sericytochromatia bacterium]|nr:hypothetical protein [Candidatus Sericytochromatia bacterium]
MHGKVTADAAIFPNLAVALVTVSATVAFTKVQNGAYSLVLPAQKEREDRNDKSPTFLHHESWELVLFNDRNNNGLYEPYLQGAKSKDKDSPLLTNEYYRLGYKGYLSNSASYNFLPLNAFERGWIVISRRGGQPNQHHQDFSRSYDITQYQ